MEEIKCTDCNEDLKMWSYEECNNDTNEELKKIRGVIKTDNGDVVCPSFGYTDEYSTDEWEGEKVCKWFYSCEGTMLRLFYYNNRWYLVTHKKLDAFKSRWSCKFTFGELFQEYAEEILQSGNKSGVISYMTDRLNPLFKYCFLIKTNYQNRIVIHSHYHQKKNRLLYIGYWNETNEFVHGHDDKVNEVLIPIPRPTRLDDGVSDIKDFVNHMNYFQYQGLIGFYDSSRRTIKLVHPKYKEFYQIRGNNPNLRFRYLELRNEPEKLRMLYFLYPKQSELFDDYEDCLFNIARMIYKFYVARYIKNRYITLPREEYGIMKKCHEWYLMNRKDNRIFTKKIMEFLNEEPPLNLYKMIRRHHLQKLNDGLETILPFQQETTVLFPDNKALQQLVFTPFSDESIQ